MSGVGTPLPKERRTMNKPSRIPHICAFVLALTLLLSGASSGQTPAPAKPPVATGAAKASTPAASSAATSTCLGCHGPFDKLVAATANYVMPSGEKTTPHRYVPHKSKDVPDCGFCHTPHPVPLTSTKGLPKPKTDYCYTCHHAGELACGTCH